MSAVVDLPMLAQKARDVLESGDPQEVQDYRREAGLAPRIFLSQYAAGADQALAALVEKMREWRKRYEDNENSRLALSAGQMTPDEFATATGISDSTFDNLLSQVAASVRASVPYTSLMDEMRQAVVDRADELLGKTGGNASHEARRAKAYEAAQADMAAIDAAEANWARPVVSDWLAKRFDDDRWVMAPIGKFAAEAVQTRTRELMSRGLSALVLHSQQPSKTSITEALKENGFERVRGALQVGEHPTFMRDGVRIAMRRGGLDVGEGGALVATADPGTVTLEALFTERDASRIGDMRDALAIVTQAADDIGMSLCVNPFPIELGSSMKPLAGEPLRALYGGIGFESASDGTAMTRSPRPPESLARLLNESPVPCSDQELEEIAAAYKRALQSQEEDGWQMHHLFDEPEAVVRLDHKAREFTSSQGFMSPDAAKAVVEGWKQAAMAQGGTNANAEKVVISLFDKTGAWSKPWRDAGYQVYQFDIQSGDGVESLGINVGDVTNFDVNFFNDIYASFDGLDVHCVLAATPCTDFASSGSRHFETKDAAGTTAFSVGLGRIALATIEYFKPAVWSMENPTGRIERLVGLPEWTVSFDPWHFGEDYTKKTMLWGRMNGDMPIAPTEPSEGSKMHSQYGGKSIATKNARSVTPEGFAYAFFMANNALDNPALAVHGKYDRLDKGLIQEVLDAGISAKEIDSIVEDFYYFDLDDDGATQALRDALGSREAAKDRDLDSGPTLG